jgi:hypothetical protein
MAIIYLLKAENIPIRNEIKGIASNDLMRKKRPADGFFSIRQ